MAKATVFERAARAAESGSSAECAKLLSELTALQRTEQPALEATRPPESAYARTGSGHIAGTYQTEAGSKYTAAALSDDPSALAAVIAEHARLSERAAEIERLRYRLEQRRKTAAEQERQAAAPGRCKEIVTSMDVLLERVEGAMAEFAAARDQLEAAVRDLGAQRALAGETAPALSLEQFRRAGVALGHRLVRTGEQNGSAPLFGSAEQALRVAREVLPGPSPSLVERIRQLLKSINAAAWDSFRERGTDREVRERVDLWQQERVRLLAAGDVDGAARLGPPRYEPGSQGKPTFGEAA